MYTMFLNGKSELVDSKIVKVLWKALSKIITNRKKTDLKTSFRAPVSVTCYGD